MKLALLSLCVAIALNAQAQTPQLVYDFAVDTGSYPANYITFDGKMFFSAITAPVGNEMWSYTGTGNPVKEFAQYGINNLTTSSNFAVMNGKLYFAANNDPLVGDELMVYDGIDPPTLVADLLTGPGSSEPFGLTAINNRLYFSAIIPGAGRELYVYDGIDPPVPYDISPYFDQGYPLSSNPSGFTEFNGKVYFKANTPIVGFELFVFDPANNTFDVAADIAPGGIWANISNIIRHNDKLYFAAQTPDYGRELYSYDGTTAVRLTDLAPGPPSGLGDLTAIYNDELYFQGSPFGTPGNYPLFKFNFNTNQASIIANEQPFDAVVYGNKLYYSGSDDFKTELWVYDGLNTTMLPVEEPSGWGSNPYALHVYNNNLYFTATNDTSGWELFSLTDPAGITNTKLYGTITLSPNPTTGNATLLLSLNAPVQLSIIITDATGTLIWEKAATNYPTGSTDVVLPVAEQSAGIYFYSVRDSACNTMASGKLQKQ